MTEGTHQRRRTACWQVRCRQRSPLTPLVVQTRRTRPSRCASPGGSSTRSDHWHLKPSALSRSSCAVKSCASVPCCCPQTTLIDDMLRDRRRTDSSLKALGEAVLSCFLTNTWPCCTCLQHHTTPPTPHVALAAILKFQQAGKR